MAQEVSPAVVVIVVILLLAVMVSLYFLATTEQPGTSTLTADTPAPARLKTPAKAGTPTAKEAENGGGTGGAECVPATNTLAPAPSS